jgi:methyl-accepting chemotaxis protein
MKLKQKLPLSFGAVLFVMLLAGVVSLFRMDQAIVYFETDVQALARVENRASEAESHFKTQVQEWKNVLLRGYATDQFKRFWTAFEKQEQAVAEDVRAVAEAMKGEPEIAALADQFLQAHQKMAEGYRRGLAAFEASNFDSRAGDQAVSGMDREPARLLRELQTAITEHSLALQAEAARNAHQTFYVSLGVLGVLTLLGILFSLWMSKSLVSPIQASVAFANQVAKGDLTAHTHITGTDEVSDLRFALKDMQASLAGIVANVRQAAQGLSSASDQIASGNHDLSVRTEHQASSLEETAASMEQLTEAVNQNAASASEANRLAEAASQVAMQGGQAVSEVVQTMRGISESSRRIGDIIGVIDGIAFQTNILALNAAVEAARAGEAGRGFAVVASEVRSLAGRSGEAAREIKSLIGTSLERVEAGNLQVDRAGATMQQVVDSIQRVTQLVASITAASREQSEGVSQIGSAVQQLDQATQQNAALVEEMAAAAQSLHLQASELMQTVSVFRLGSEAPGSQTVLPATATAPKLSSRKPPKALPA